MGKRAKSEATRGTSSPDVIEDNAQRSDARGMSTTVQHAKEGQSERKHGRIRNSAKSRPTTQSAGGDPGRSIINGGSPGRKSPRKSPPTQFYHSLLLGNRSEVGGGASSGGRSFDPTASNDEGRSLRMIPDPGLLRPRSKRTSPSFKEGFADVAAAAVRRRCRRRIRQTGGEEEEEEAPTRTPQHFVAIRA